MSRADRKGVKVDILKLVKKLPIRSIDYAARLFWFSRRICFNGCFFAVRKCSNKKIWRKFMTRENDTTASVKVRNIRDAENATSFCKATTDWWDAGNTYDSRLHLSFVEHTGKANGCKQVKAVVERYCQELCAN